MVLLSLLALAGVVAAGVLRPTNEVQFANDDHAIPPPDTTPPPLPTPRSAAEAAEWMTANPIYQETMPAPIRCNVPRIDFSTAGDAELKQHFENLMECTVRAWEVPATNAGFRLVRPTVTIYADKVTTKCGTSGVNAMYCGLDQQLYFSRLLPQRVPKLAKDPWSADLIMAHEFGHAVQGRTGILSGFIVLANQTPGKSDQLLLSRRVETQADCLAGMFTRAVSYSIGLQQADVDNLLESFHAFGSDVLTGKKDIESDHGLGSTRRYWAQTGMANFDVGACNTFTADPSVLR